jgi:alpha-L-rhamnosidase
MNTKCLIGRGTPGWLMLLGLLGASLNPAAPARAAQQLDRDFQQPPASARPWVYWFWLNGNITSNGITADLEAMKRVGIGGVLIMEVDQGAPVGPADFMGSQWRELFKHVVGEARRLGLEVNMNNDAGWNGSGGPWIKPEQSMQKVVWSETNLTGPSRFEGPLAQPEVVAGYYRDISVLAFPTPGAYRIDRIKAKAMYETGGVGDIPRNQLPAEMVIPRDRVVDLTSQMDSNGHVAWDIPAGQWTVLRLGNTSTGVKNAPAPATGAGLECDKLSRQGIEANFAGMMAKLTADNHVGPDFAANGLVATHIDSWENGSQNWTAKMREEFQQRRGYDMSRFLPVMTGRVVDSLEISERFLWDLRRTISELVVENYAGRLHELAKANGLRFTVEAYGSPCDCIPYGGEADEPMGEFWTPSGAIETCKGMACAGHVYGKRIIGAESFTSGDQEKWREHPATLKGLGDTAFCEGINRFVFHRYAMQPWAQDRRPGMTMGPWGQHYERTETWWEESPAWHQYLARCQFMLRRGLFVADICYMQPEMPPQGFIGHPRPGYDWDECGAEVVLNRMSVKNGRIVLPDGMSYRLLVLPQTGMATPALLRKVRALVQAGATVMGSPPAFSPSLNGYPGCDQEVKDLAREIWGDADGAKVKEHRLGAGRVIWSGEPEKVLQASGVPPDFASGQPLRWIHRVDGDSEIYFVANPSLRNFNTTASFRVAGKLPELWWPDTGRIESAPVFQAQDGVTSVSLTFGPNDSVFVVFRKPRTRQSPLLALVRDGKPVLSARPEPAPRVLIQQASYGLLGDPRQTRDVREKVQQKVDSGQYSFPVGLMAEGADPAPEKVKTLVVEYRIEGKQYTAQAKDSSTIHLTTNAVKVTVEKARYGVLDDPKRTRDVRQKLQALVDAGESSFVVARMAEGDDPAFLVVKTLEVEYSLNGQHRSVKGTDPDLIDLNPLAVERTEPVAQARRDPSGKLLVQAFKPGRYELQFANGKPRTFTVPEVPQAVEVTGPWEVRFTPGWGAPAETTFDKLVSWTSHSDPGIKYYSGTGTYRTSFNVPRALLKGDRLLYLDLGNVQVMAEVKLNGRNLGLLWKPPFRVEITGAAKAGENKLEVKVVNLWPNRQIGDEQLPEDSERNPDGTLKRWPQWLLEGKPSPAGRFTFTSWRLWKKGDALFESGLLGPVRVVVAQQLAVKPSD